MDIDRYLSEAMEESRMEQEPQKKWDPSIAVTTGSDYPTGCFDCNICLEFAQDPVVTLCGHLYCWPCIYRWLSVDNTTTQQRCPVCKAGLTESTLVPLYGRGEAPKPKAKLSLPKLEIPRRPLANRPESLTSPATSLNSPSQTHHHHHHHHQHFYQHQHQHYSPQYNHYMSSSSLPSPSLNFRGATTTTTHVFHPTASAVANMAISVLPWLFGCPGTGMYFPNGNTLVGSNPNGPRLRRQEVQAERSLSRIWAFLLCCCILCLVFF